MEEDAIYKPEVHSLYCPVPLVFLIITGIYTIYTYKSINEIKVLMVRK